MEALNIVQSKAQKYSIIGNLISDARNPQILLQFSFLIYGILFLSWEVNIFYYLIIIGSSLLFQAIFTYFTDKNFLSLKSGFITALSLSLILKSTSFWVLILAAFLSILSKYIFRFRKKHFFNPSNFGIIVTLLLTGKAWVSPGQWGTDMILAVLIIIGGLNILLKVGRLDAALTFLLTYSTLLFFRIVVYYGWEADVFFHSISNGTLLLFTFFMITDPKSSPDNSTARIIWAFFIALLSFILTSWFYVFSAPLWALFILSPFTVLLDSLFKSKRYEWITK
ncbi:MAG TPA: Na+-transporting NADH:ubiquinone oxidoreductase, subunit NqrB [Flavobacteriales bacterium]|nr:Na+-transporting NADH:ubiquinone oxidoreductase, subunit NqrB [Flavobacteriales bacterium]|tara:strand:- start:27800 stop:28642 length:843 start_codon:yes stop_codon:yes gene_type:complete